MTTDEAKTKWCPMARVTRAQLDEDGHETPIHVQSYNRFVCSGDTNEETIEETGLFCVADLCACWVFDNDLVDCGHCGLAR